MPLASSTRAARVSGAPDRRLEGRVVYTIAIQMPNVTSHSGSWLVWFAEREPVPGLSLPDVQPPSPLRKVDPKYIVTAAEERIDFRAHLGFVGPLAMQSFFQDIDGGETKVDDRS